MKMQGVILAGGQGKRLRPLTDDKPKPLIRIANKPLIAYVLDALLPHVDEFIIVIGYKGEKIKEQFGTIYKDTPITYIEQQERLGTGHALMLCKEHIKGSFVLMYADEIIDDPSITKLVTYPAAALAHRRKHPEQFGVFVVDDAYNLLDVEEKPKNPRSDLCSAAAFKLTPAIFKHYPPPPHENGEHYLADMIPSYLQEQPMKVVESKLGLTVNKPGDIPEVEKQLKKFRAQQ